MNWNSVLGNATKTFHQATQLAKEKLGGPNVDITELPAEYRELEAQVDKVKTFYESFVKVYPEIKPLGISYSYFAKFRLPSSSVGRSKRSGPKLSTLFPVCCKCCSKAGWNAALYNPYISDI